MSYLKRKGETKEMKKFLKALLIFVVIVEVVLGGYYFALNRTKKQALDTVDKVFTAIKTGDEQQIKQYLSFDALDEEDNSEDDADSEQMAKTMLKNLKYEVVSTDVTLKECHVKVDASNKDLKTVFGNYMKKAIGVAFSQAFGGNTSEEDMNAQMQKYFEEEYNSDEVPMVTNSVTFDLKKDNGKWKVNCDENELVNAILPGYKDVENTLNSIGNDEE